MAGPLTPKCQYNHVTKTFIAFSTCSTCPAAVSTLYWLLEQLTSALTAATVVSFPDPSYENLRTRSNLIAFLLHSMQTVTHLLCWAIYHTVALNRGWVYNMYWAYIRITIILYKRPIPTYTRTSSWRAVWAYNTSRAYNTYYTGRSVRIISPPLFRADVREIAHGLITICTTRYVCTITILLLSPLRLAPCSMWTNY